MMAETPEQALVEMFEAISDRQRMRVRDAVHLPFVHFGWHPSWSRVAGGPVRLWAAEEDVPEYQQFPEAWAGSYCTLDHHELVIGNEEKRAYQVAGTRYRPDGSVLQTFEAIYTVVNVDGDWRVGLRNPVNIVPGG